MSQQLTITNYFKSKSYSPGNMENSKNKKFNLSLTKKTTKMLHMSNTENEHVIDLVSDDDEIFNGEFIKCSTPSDKTSDSSTSTMIYSLETPSKSLISPKRNMSSSPRSKFYSPTKKRCISLKTPTKAKKNLIKELSSTRSADIDLTQVCEGLDDKTIFLATIIYEYLKDESLKPLLKEPSLDLLKVCMQVKKPGLRIVCRLFWRQEGWYRLAQVKNLLAENGKTIDDSSFHEVLNSLMQSGLITAANNNVYGSRSDLSFDEYVKILKSEEVKEICKELKLKCTKKQDAIDVLKRFSSRSSNITSYFSICPSNNEARVLKSLCAKTGPCFKLSDLARTTLNELYLLTYLGLDNTIIREKKLELKLLNRKTNRETYPYNESGTVDNASVVFPGREEFERYMIALTVCDNYYDVAVSNLDAKCEMIRKVNQLSKNIDKNEMTSYITLPCWLRRFTSAHQYVKVLEDSIQYLKKNKTDIVNNISLALDILSTLISQNVFRQHKKAEWYAEKALILDKHRSADEAAETLLNGFNSSLSEEAKDVLRPRARNMVKRLTKKISGEMKKALHVHVEKESILEKEINDKHIYKQPIETLYGRGKIQFETRNAEGRILQDAEAFCVSYYIEEGLYTHGGHWEGRMVTTMFFLLFWDVVYAELRDCRGLVLSRLQQFPLDLFTAAFYQNRASLIEDRLNYVAGATVEVLLADMKRIWDSRPECELSCINRQIGWENISMASTCLGPAGLAAVCRRLAHDYRYAHSGFPDLTLWNMSTQQIIFVEVKTDLDKPSIKQRQWMHYLKRNGIPTEFCYVGVNTTRSRARRRTRGGAGDSVPQGVAGNSVPRAVAEDSVPRAVAGDSVAGESEAGDSLPRAVAEDSVPRGMAGDSVPRGEVSVS